MNEKMRVSEEMIFLEARRAFDHTFDWRNVGRGDDSVSAGVSGPERSNSLDAVESVPMWYFGIMALAVSESIQCISKRS